MANKYWEEETPEVVDTGRNVLRYYEKADKLQVLGPGWIDDNGELRPGKAGALDLCAVAETPEAVELLRRIVDGME